MAKETVKKATKYMVVTPFVYLDTLVGYSKGDIIELTKAEAKKLKGIVEIYVEG